MTNEPYQHSEIERKWQKQWKETDLYRTTEDSKKGKRYVLDMFPYPSGEGLHVGHPKGYIATDIYSRFSRMQGFSVLHPMGWDAFGLPAENYAIKNKVHPRAAVEKNIANFKQQLAHLGFDYDWSREINTTDSAYYHWTQWTFLKMLENKIAFLSDEPINWCPSCKTGLANEDLDGAACERCGTPIVKKKMPQWVLKITDYADRMLADLDSLNWPEHIKEAQRNWIGRSEGTEFDFALEGRNEKITVFTTRPDTIFGVTYVVLAPEYPLIATLLQGPTLKNADAVTAYVTTAATKTEIERGSEGREKTGVQLEGVMAVNPATGEAVPVFVADYVLGSYGTGAVMAVPAHDERDYAFAQKFGLPNIEKESAAPEQIDAIGGKKITHYKLRDWVFSRQRYWGEPIPVIHCEQCGIVPVPYEDLPVMLPEVESYEPTDTGESPLAAIDSWVNTTCPKCKGPSKRETNTMPQWAGSSWYYLRFMDPHDNTQLVSTKAEKYWAPVDVYVGGDHAVRHLIYARFWHKFLYDIGIVSTTEPFARLEFLGFILDEHGAKMSKSKGNVINPDDVVAQYGADAFRLYEMFMAPFENTTAWSTTSIAGAARFVARIWSLNERVTDETVVSLDQILHETVKKVGDDIEGFKFNTAVSQMMIFLNAAEKVGAIGKEQWQAYLRVLAPFAPHITEELWERMGEAGSIHYAPWPAYDPSLLVASEVNLTVQVNGKRRGSVRLAVGASEVEAVSAARQIKIVATIFADKKPKRVIYLPGKILNLVV